MPPDSLHLTQRQLDEIVSHARARPDEEVCGLLAGEGIRVAHVYAVPNASPAPASSFRMDGQAFVDAYLDLERNGWELIAIYHSHPRGLDSLPSATDVANANYPDALNLIVSFDAGGMPLARVFEIANGIFREARLKVGPDVT